MPQLDSDSFTYSDGNLAVVSAGKWTALSGAFGFGDPPVVGNRLAGPGNENAAVITTWAGSLTLQWSEVVWISGDYGGPTIFNDGVRACYLLDITAASTQLFWLHAGIYTPLGLGGQGAGPGGVSGHTYRLAVSVAGVIVGTDNGVTLFTYAPETNLTSGRPGVRNWSAVLDSWAAGDFSVAVVVGTDASTAWAKKQAAVRANVNLDLTTALAKRRATIRAASSSPDFNTQIRDYYAQAGNLY